MSGFGDAHESMRLRQNASRRLAGMLDRAVVVARVGQLSAFAGRLVVGATVAIAAIALGSGLGLHLPFPAGPIVVAAAIGIGGLLGSRRWTWPDRLSTAMAVERAHPQIGERISRAVAFIGLPFEESGSAKDLPVFDLVGEALDEAATVLDGLAEDRSGRRRVVCSSLFPLRWPVAGLAAVAAVVIAAFAVPGRLLPPLAEAFRLQRSTRPIAQPPQAAPASGLPKAAFAVAGRLAEAAAAEDRLAAALIARFAASPGVIRKELPRVEQEWLDGISSLQTVIAEDIGRDLATVVAAAERDDPRLAAELAEGVVRERAAGLDAAAGLIRENRLAAASGLIAGRVRPILSALRARGVVPSGKTGPAFDREELVRRRIVSAIEGHEKLLSRAVEGGGWVPTDGEVDLSPVGGAEHSPAASPPVFEAADRPGHAAGGMAGDAGGPAAGGAEEAVSGGTGLADAVERLPAWVRAREERSTETVLGDEFAAPPRYRDAVNDYYRRLWAAESPMEPGASKQEGSP